MYTRIGNVIRDNFNCRESSFYKPLAYNAEIYKNFENEKVLNTSLTTDFLKVACSDKV